MSKLFYQRVDTVGDGSGNSNMAVDGSITPVVFKISPGEGETIKLARIMIYVEDSGAFDADKWGNGITLANGIDFKVSKNGVVSDLLGFSIKSSGEMASICHDINHESFGIGNEFVSFRWTFEKAGSKISLRGSGLILGDAVNDELQLIVNDDLRGLVKMYVHAQGIYA